MGSRSIAQSCRPLRRGLTALLVASSTIATSGILMATPTRALAAGNPTPVIVDTDIYSNTDDEGALAVAFALQLEGQVNVLGIGVNTRLSRPAVATNSWKCAAAIAQFYGFPNTPIGSDTPDNGTTVNSPDIVGPCAALASPSTPQPVPAVSLYRKLLASQADGSVVMVGTGYEENLANLLTSPPDASSPLTGSALVAEKVQELVVMGGGYPSRTGENNFIGNPTAAESVASSWPTKVVYSGYEVGYGVFTGHTLTSVHPTNSPIRVAYQALVGSSANNRSYDITALYHALVPTDLNLTEVGPGTNSIDSTGANTFTLGAGDEYYLLLGSATGLASSIEHLMDVLPGTTPQSIAFTSSPGSPLVGSAPYAPSASPGASGVPVTYAIDPSSTSGCTYDFVTGLVTFAAPAGTCVVDADEGGTTVYAAAPQISQSFSVSLATQSITFTSTPPTSPRVGLTYQVAASASSGLPVSFSVDAASGRNCTISGSSFTIQRSGLCEIDANQSGNNAYQPAPQVQQVEASANQTVRFTTRAPSGARVFGTYAVAATASSGLPVTISIDPSSSAGCSYDSSKGLVSFTGPAGTCVIDAAQAGNALYNPASAQQNVKVAKAAQTITFLTTPPPSAVVGSTYPVAASATSGLSVTLTIDRSSRGSCTIAGGVVSFVARGTCVVDANQAGNATYASAPQVQQSFAIKP